MRKVAYGWSPWAWMIWRDQGEYEMEIRRPDHFFIERYPSFEQAKAVLEAMMEIHLAGLRHEVISTENAIKRLQKLVPREVLAKEGLR